MRIEVGADMSNEKSKEEIRRRFQELDKDIHFTKGGASRARAEPHFDVKLITMEAKDNLRKFRKKL